MLLEQTYNADAKEESGLGSVTTNPSARTKWVYTKCLTSVVSSQLKTMLHLHSQNCYIHHKVGQGSQKMQRWSSMLWHLLSIIHSPHQLKI